MAQPGPLAGVRVIDFSRVLAGPYVGRIFADLGADVIKVEPPDGDVIREIAPRRDRGMSGMYTMVNVGKRNVSIDLRAPGAAELALELVRRADAVIENFRPGVAERLGIGWSAVHAANPRAVMVSISGYGEDSSWRDRSAFAPTIHAVSGIMEWQAFRSGNPVAPPADAAADMITGLHATIGLLTALRDAERTGEGQRVEVAMYDALLATYSEAPQALLDPPESTENSRVFDAGPHGLILIAGAPQHVWRALVATFPGELHDPAERDAPVPEKARLRAEAIEAWLRSRPSLEACARDLDRARLACARVEGLRDSLTGPLAEERELLVDVDDRSGGTRPVVRLPDRVSRSSAAVRGPAPRRHEHGAEVLKELLDLDSARLADLVAKGVIPGEPDRG
jgi:CoA:oxalate CoA-transferase